MTIEKGARIAWRPEALDDLENVRAIIEHDNPLAAAETVLTILDAVDRLADQPSLGRPGRVPRTRELIVVDTPYVVPYRVKDGVVEVLRVFHGARRWPSRIARRRRK